MRMENDAVEIDTPFAGKIKVGWNDIQHLTSTRPLTLIFHGSANIPAGIGTTESPSTRAYSA